MIGKKILHYNILEKLGEGGMGIVYKAEDTKLKREVAIKFLPRHIAGNAEDRGRFKIEAQAAAALNHPNIATIYAIEENDDDVFIVMEYIDGRELKDLIAGNPGMDVESGNVGAKHSWQPSESKSTDPARNASPLPLPLDDAINYSAQIASGLQAAHAKGIIHRDIKSSNIMVTNTGQVKIMDFGLAKIGSDSQITKAGTTLGTAAYMSPEQASGEAVDHRSDFWSFGVVLYEMLTGQLPFRGEYEQAVIYSILNETPRRISERRDDVPIELEAIVMKMLAKNVEDRYQSAAELQDVLQLRSETAANKASTLASKVPVGSTKGLLVLGVITFIIILIFVLYLQIGHEPKPIRLTNPKKVTHSIGLENFPTWSPDGSKIAYASYQTGQFISDGDIWVKQLSSGEAINMTGNIAVSGFWPSWSPDGSQIAFSAAQDRIYGIWIMPAIGGASKKITSTWLNSNPVWSADGSQIAHVIKDSSGTNTAELFTLSTYEKNYISLPGEHWERDYLSWSPDADYFAFADADNLYGEADVSSISIVRIADGAVYQIPNHASLDFFPTWSPDGRRLYFISDRGGTPDLWEVKIGTDGRPADNLVQISHGLGLESLALSPDGTKLAFSKEQRTANLWRIIIPQGNAPIAKWADAQQLTFESSIIQSPDISPDGKQLYFSSDRKGNWDIWAMPLAGGEMRQLTNSPEDDDSKALSPDGSTLAFVSERNGWRDIWTIPASGGPARQITNNQVTKFWPRWSPDGQNLAFSGPDSNSSNLSLWIVPALGGKVKQIAIAKELYVSLWWPDGQSLLSIGNVADHWGLWRFPITGGDPMPLTGPNFKGYENDLQWSSDLTKIYYIGDFDTALNIGSFSVADGSVRQLTDFSGRYGNLGRTFATDGKYFYFTWHENTGDIWVMDVELED